MEILRRGLSNWLVGFWPVLQTVESPSTLRFGLRDDALPVRALGRGGLVSSRDGRVKDG